MAEEHVVARVNELCDGERIVVEIGGRSIGVFNRGGNFYAIRNRCAHQGGPVCEGAVLGSLRAEVLPSKKVREYWDNENPIVACPWHGWEYDLKTGGLLGDTTRRIAVYKTKIVGDEVRVLV